MQLLETQRPTLPTIPIGAAQVFASDLAAKGGDFNNDVAQNLQAQLAVAELSGLRRIDVEAAVVGALGRFTHEAVVEDSIDCLIDQVIDLR